MTKGFLIALAVSLVFSGITSAQTTIDAGFDLFVTQPVQTFIDLSDLLPICPDATTGLQVPLHGVPLVTFPPAPGADLGDADTIIERKADGPLSGGTTTIPIEMVELQLRSVDPIQVDCGTGGTELWMLDIRLDVVLPPEGQITATKTHANGGTYQAILPVKPMLAFTRVDAPEPDVVVEPGLIHLLPDNGIVPWVYSPPGSILQIPGTTSNFFPGIASDGALEDIALSSQAPVGIISDLHLVHQIALVPEPATLSLLALSGLALIRRRQR